MSRDLLPAQYRLVSHEHNPAEGSMDAVQLHFADVFGDRNEVYLPNRSERITLFDLGVRDLVDARRNDDRTSMEQAFARIGSRVFGIANGINNLSVSRGMEVKYPESGCVYCGASTCVCTDSKGVASIDWSEPTDSPRANWSITDWQDFLNSMYGDVNSERGQEAVINRLYTEISEVRQLEHALSRMKLGEIYSEYSLELADLMGWTLGAASLSDINLEAVMLDRYGQGCPTCGGQACACTVEQFDHVF